MSQIPVNPPVDAHRLNQINDSRLGQRLRISPVSNDQAGNDLSFGLRGYGHTNASISNPEKMVADADIADMAEELSVAASGKRRRTAHYEEESDLEFLNVVEEIPDNEIGDGDILRRGESKKNNATDEAFGCEKTANLKSTLDLHDIRQKGLPRGAQHGMSLGNYLSAGLAVSAFVLAGRLDISGGTKIQKTGQVDTGADTEDIVLQFGAECGSEAISGYRFLPIPGEDFSGNSQFIFEINKKENWQEAHWIPVSDYPNLEAEARFLAVDTLAECLDIFNESYPGEHLGQQILLQMKEFGTLYNALTGSSQRGRVFAIYKAEQKPLKILTYHDGANALVAEVNRRLGSSTGMSGDDLARRLIAMAE